MIGLESPFPVVVIIYHLRWLLKHFWIRSESIFVPNVGYSSDWVGFIMQVHIYHLSFNPRPSGTNMLISSRWSFISSKPVWNEDTEEIWTSDSLLEFMYWSEFNSMICFVFLFFIFILPQITWSSPLVMLALFCQYFL